MQLSSAHTTYSIFSKKVKSFINKHLFFILINIIFTTLYLFSNLYNYTDLIVKVNKNTYSIFLSGKKIDLVYDDSFKVGGIKIIPVTVEMPFDLPIRPKIKSLEVYDLKGKSKYKTKNQQSTGYQIWDNYIARIKISGIPHFLITLHQQPNDDGITFVSRAFISVDSGFKRLLNGQETILTSNTNLDLGLKYPLILLINLFTQSYPYALIIIAFVYLIINLIPSFHLEIFSFQNKYKREVYFILSSILIVFTFLFLRFITIYLLDATPHVPDSFIYLMQAKIFATGRIFTSPTIFKDYYEFFDSLRGGMIYQNGKWFSQYSFGHPLLLSLGIILKMPWLIPPLIGTLFLVLFHLLSVKLFNKRVTILVSIILIMSPFYQSNATNFMSHNSAVFYLMGFLYFFFITFTDKSRINPIISSIFFGLLFNTRILIAVAITVVSFLYCLMEIKQWRKLIYFLPGGLLFLSLYFGYNYILTGTPFTNPYQLTDTPPLGFSPQHTLSSALLDGLTNSAYFFTYVFGWPQKFTFLFVLLALIIPPVNKKDVFFVFSIFSIFIAWLWFDGSYIMYGPRYYYEMLPFLLLLSASGIQKLIAISKHKSFTYIIVSLIIMAITIRLINGWIFKKEVLWELADTPSNLWQLKGFNYVDGKYMRIFNPEKLDNSVIFIKNCGYGWWCDTPFISLNNPDFDGKIIWAKDKEIDNQKLYNLMPNRKYYRYDTNKNTLERLKINF